MVDGGFYITLPCNASATIFLQNTSSNFIVQLERPLELSGKWEVGLVETEYLHSWNNINEDAIFEIALQGKMWQYTLQKGYYPSLSMLME